MNGGIPVAAKTGTAELGDPSNPDLSHAWIVAFAPADDPQYAVSVVLTNVQSTADVAATGGRLAGPIAKGMLDFLLTGPGAQPVSVDPGGRRVSTLPSWRRGATRRLGCSSRTVTSR